MGSPGWAEVGYPKGRPGGAIGRASFTHRAKHVPKPAVAAPKREDVGRKGAIRVGGQLVGSGPGKFPGKPGSGLSGRPACGGGPPPRSACGLGPGGRTRRGPPLRGALRPAWRAEGRSRTRLVLPKRQSGWRVNPARVGFQARKLPCIQGQAKAGAAGPEQFGPAAHQRAEMFKVELESRGEVSDRMTGVRAERGWVAPCWLWGT